MVSSPRSRSLRGRAGAAPPIRPRCCASSFPAAETGFDPVRVSDLYSNTVNEAIFERLLTYDYLARPAKLVPMVAEAMPEVSDNGRTYMFRLKKGIYFTPDPAFKGVKRELVAEDFVYSFKRFVDPKNRSPWAFMIEGKIEGLDAAIAAAKKTGKFDYDAKISGLAAVDRYTLRIRLTERRLPVQLHRGARPLRRGRARGGRGLRRRPAGAPGRHRALRAEGVEAGGEDRARGQSRLSRLHLGLRRRRPGRGTTRWSRR